MLEAYEYSFTLGDIIAGGLTLFSVVLAYFFGTFRERRKGIDEKSERYYQHILSASISLKEELENIKGGLSTNHAPMPFAPTDWQTMLGGIIDKNEYYLDSTLCSKVREIDKQLKKFQIDPSKENGFSSSEEFEAKRQETLQDVNQLIDKLENYYMQYPLKMLWYLIWNFTSGIVKRLFNILGLRNS